jgi:multimeric flavodoxin WrbA
MFTILGVVGSPRRSGNTHVLVSRALEGAEAAGARTEKIMLGEMSIRECDGCHACWRGKPCGKDDDMRGVYPKLAAADAVVFGTPVYWYGPTALMKAFIDRFVFFNCQENRPQVRGKPAAIIVPFEEADPQAAALVVAFFEKSLAYLEMPLAARLLVPGVARKGDVLKKEAALREARDLGRALAGGARAR